MESTLESSGHKTLYHECGPTLQDHRDAGHHRLTGVTQENLSFDSIHLELSQPQ